MKYMGSKRLIAKEIVPIIEYFRDKDMPFIEPFCGGCNVTESISGLRFASDSDEYLIAMWKALQCGWIPPLEVGEKMYADIKKNRDDYPMELVGYVGFNLSFGAKFFGGFRRDKKGLRNYSDESYRNVTKQIDKLRDVIFQHGSYDELYENIESPCLFYCDPPYKNTTNYRDIFDHKKFYNWCRKKAKEGHIILLSEYESPKDFECIWSKEIVSHLRRKNREKKNEKLFILVNE